MYNWKNLNYLKKSLLKRAERQNYMYSRINLAARGRTLNPTCLKFQKHELMCLQKKNIRPLNFGNKLKVIILIKLYDFIRAN